MSTGTPNGVDRARYNVCREGARVLLEKAAAAHSKTWVRHFLEARGLNTSDLGERFNRLHSPPDTLLSYKYEVIANHLAQPVFDDNYAYYLVVLAFLWYFGTKGFKHLLGVDRIPASDALVPRPITPLNCETIARDLHGLAYACRENGLKCTRAIPPANI